MKAKLERLMLRLGKHADQWWYAPVIGLLAFADLFILIIPTDAILISAVLIAPKRWLLIGTMVAAGSALGAVALTLLLRVEGLPWLLHFYPGIDHTKAWATATRLVDSWGGWGLFTVALSPIPQHAAIAVAAITGLGLPTIFVTVFAGRTIKYVAFSWIASHAPKLLGRIFGVKFVKDLSQHEVAGDLKVEDGKPKSSA
jgi:membrane protein YqaA with SNARE-associated domain